MYRYARLAGFLALLVTPVALLAATMVRPSTVRPATVRFGTLGLGVGVALAGGVAAVQEREALMFHAESTGFDREDTVDALAVVVAAVVTYLLSTAAGLGPVVAAAAVGLVAGVGAPRVAVPAYCGTFVGMASPSLFPTTDYVLVAGLLAAAAFVATTECFGGFGGKLGTIAFFGCATTLALPGVEYATASGLSWTSATVVVPVAVVGAVATVALSIRFDLGAVVGSASVGLVAGLALPPLVPDMGSTLAAVAFCASFVGMSTTERLGHEGHDALAGALSGLVFVAVSPAFAGAGGKLGTIAFLSCVAAFGAAELLESVTPG